MDGPVRAGWGERVSARLAGYPPVHGAVVSLAAASVGLVVVEFVALIVWTADTRSVTAASSALRVGADLWLLAHGSAMQLPDGRLEVLPFGLALLPVVLAASAGHRLALARLADPPGPFELDGSPRQRWHASSGGRVPGTGSDTRSADLPRNPVRRTPQRRTDVRSARSAGPAGPVRSGSATSWRAVASDVVLVSVPYVALVCLIALIASDDGARPAVLPAVLTTLSLAGAGATLGALRGYGGQLPVWRALPRAGRDVLAAGAAGAAAAVAIAGVMFVVLLAARFPEVAAATRDLDTDLDIGLVGGVALFVGQAVVLPNVVLWAAAYALGTGTATGGGGVLRPGQADPAQLPDLPLFAALPTTALPPSAWLVLALVPAVSGLMVAVFTRRARGADRFGAQLVRAAVSAGVCGVIIGVGAHVSGASAGATRIGPAGRWTGLAAAGEVAVAAMVALAIGQLVRRRRRLGFPADAGAAGLTKSRSSAERTSAERTSGERSRVRLPGSRRSGQPDGRPARPAAPQPSERSSTPAAAPARRPRS